MFQLFLGDRGVDLNVTKDADGAPSENPNVKVYMQSRLPNPHYIPEVQAQTTQIGRASCRERV